MSVQGFKRRAIPILSYELHGLISDENGFNNMRWSNTHTFYTLIGTFQVSVGRKPRKLRDLLYFKHYPGEIFAGNVSVSYEKPDFETYKSDDAEYLERNLPNAK